MGRCQGAHRRSARRLTLLVSLMANLLALLALTGCAENVAPNAVLMQDEWEYKAGFQPEWLSQPSSGWTATTLPRGFEVPQDLPSWPAYVTLRHKLPPKVHEWAEEGKGITFRSGRVSDVSWLYIDDTLLESYGSVTPYSSGLYRHYLLEIPSALILERPQPYLYMVLYSDGIYPLKFEGLRTIVGVSRDVYTRHYLWEIYLFSLLGIYLVVGLYHLVLYFYRPADVKNLFFALFCPSVSFYFFFRSFSRDLVFGNEAMLRLRTEYIVLVIASLFFSWFSILLFKRPRHSLAQKQVPTTLKQLRLTTLENRLERFDRRLITVTTSISFGLILIMAFAGYRWMRIALFSWQAMGFLTFAYILYRIVLKFIHGETWARPMVIGFFIFFFGTFRDMLAVHGYSVIELGSASTAFLFFVLSIALALARQFRDVYQEVDDLSVHLDQKVQERTLELEQAKSVAEESSRIKSTFLAHLSHEIRTPLHGMLGLGELLLQSPVTFEQRSMLKLMQSLGQNFLQLLNDVLTTAKLEAGKLELHPQPFDLHASIRQVCSIFELGMGRAQVQFHFTRHEDVPRVVKGDSGRLRQIMANLLSNAFKFTQRGDIWLEVSPGPDAQPEDKVQLRVSVKDTGIGVTPEFQSRIFESFAQADSSMSRIYGGSGLGTTIANHLVSMMSGSIGLRSPIREADENGGPGSEFWFTVVLERVPVEQWASVQEDVILPPDSSGKVNVQDLMDSQRGILERPPTRKLESLAAESLKTPERTEESGEAAPQVVDGNTSDAGPVASQSEAEQPGLNTSPALPEALPVRPFRNSSPSSLRGLSVLVAEDNAINQLIMKRLLLGMGHQVEIANDGMEAVSKAKASRYDLIFMDIQMPNLNGFEAAEAIRAECGREVPIIALTANAFPEDVARGEQVGMNSFLAKPCTRDELRETIERWTIGRKS